MPLIILFLHDHGRNGRDNADRHRCHEGGRKIIQRLHLAVDAVEDVCIRLGIAERRLQAVHDELCVDEVNNAQDAGAERNRNADAQQRAEDAPGRLRHIRVRGRFVRVMPVLIDRDIDERERAARRNAEDGTRRCDRQTLARARKAPRKHKADGDFPHDLQDLRNGGRLHVAHALRIAAVRARQIHEHKRRGQRPDALRCADIVEHAGQLRREQEHDQPEDQADDGKRQPRDTEDLARLHGPAERVRLADHARERDRHARRGHGEKDIINIVGNGKISIPLVAENVAERDLIDRAEDLDDHNAGRYDGRAVEIVLLAAFLQSALPPR